MTRQLLGLQKYVKDNLSAILQTQIDNTTFPFLRRTAEHSFMQSSRREEELPPITDDVTIRQNALQFLALLKRVVEMGKVDPTQALATNARVAGRAMKISFLFSQRI